MSDELNFNRKDPARYKPEVYRALHKATEIMDRGTKAFVFGLQTVHPEAWNELAGIAFNHGTHAALKATSFVLEILPNNLISRIRREGYQYLERINRG